jgi:hypothetical protein
MTGHDFLRKLYIMVWPCSLIAVIYVQPQTACWILPPTRVPALLSMSYIIDSWSSAAGTPSCLVVTTWVGPMGHTCCIELVSRDPHTHMAL